MEGNKNQKKNKKKTKEGNRPAGAFLGVQVARGAVLDAQLHERVVLLLRAGAQVHCFRSEGSSAAGNKAVDLQPAGVGGGRR